MKVVNRLKGLAGFTIIELLIATAVFSTILLIATAGLIDIGSAYYKGYVSTQTQQTARTILNDISQTIEFGGAVYPTSPGDNPTSFCVGSVRYTLTYDMQLTTPAGHAVLRDVPLSCLGSPINNPSTELMGANMRLASLQVKQIGGSNIYTITVRFVYGPDDVLSADHQRCAGGAGQQFCQTAQLTTAVQRRILRG